MSHLFILNIMCFFFSNKYFLTFAKEKSIIDCDVINKVWVAVMGENNIFLHCDLIHHKYLLQYLMIKQILA